MSEADWRDVERECPKCKEHNVKHRLVESGDGAFEDSHYQCHTPSCRYSWWIDGIDS